MAFASKLFSDFLVLLVGGALLLYDQAAHRALLHRSYRLLRSVLRLAPSLRLHPPRQAKETPLMTLMIARGLGGLTAAALLALGVAGVLAETHRAPDQP